MSAILNRLEKNHKKLAPWAKRVPVEAWRLYDRDIPEYPFIVDVYGDFLLVHDKSDARIDAEKNHLPEVLEALRKIFQAGDERIVLKQRARQEGLNQYEKLGEKGEFLTVREGTMKFRVNLRDYLDTGLFLDHRPMRHRIQKSAKGREVLNLFCYTGSVSVAAATGGGHVTSVDMSATYLDWAEENFRLNGLSPEEHVFIQADVLQWLERPVDNVYDLIFLDPPTFSNSKRMEESFEVERDQDFLVDACMARLKPGGVLYFSNNKRSFRLSEKIKARFTVEDISSETIPQDFHDRKIHRCFRIRAR
ncbi:MAG: class I SAM-dependent methyltransferase [Bdellovibrionaceae bacterium]|nr:class I SAM-dependent methyltransferase [Pseudobdellovibrionaceae bacterium]